MSGAVERWLDERLTEVPAALAGAIRRMLPGEASGGPAAMAEAALDTFDRVAADRAGRDGALDLLAADALLTYAFQAAADPSLGGGADSAVDLAARMGPHGEIGARLARGSGGG